jgi:hypothetical protein
MPNQGSLNPGDRPRSVIEELKSKYLNRLPELMDGLFLLTRPDNPAHVRIAATRELLDRLLGRPAVCVDTTTMKPNALAVGGNGKIEKSTIAATEIQ